MPRFTPALALFAILASLVLGGCNKDSSSPEQVKAETLFKRIEAGTAPLILDVRTAEEFAAGHVPGAINIPYDEMSDRSAEIVAHKDKPVVLYCRSGRRSGIAAKTLADEGFTDLGLLEGDMPGWEAAGYTVSK